ncbi:hypothetical protein [Paraburkholderia sp. BCC1885]|uniref:hypothetical protein n=1 Tax=Paraburkholderia sp. BCC1885 TaxID=2562669 RepID=UPI0011827E40|nr:hypothetical protein [Paraburkholderia sp. BCC1885]
MNASIQMPSLRSDHRTLLCVLCSVLAAGAAVSSVPAAAQQATQPGNLIIERDITPRDAFVPVPRNDDPIAVQVQTFPTVAFDGALGAMASDLDLNSAHGTTGISTGSSFMPALVGTNGIEHMLAGNGNGSGLPVGAAAGLGGAGGIGSTITQTITGALAPLGAAMGSIK